MKKMVSMTGARTDILGSCAGSEDLDGRSGPKHVSKPSNLQDSVHLADGPYAIGVHVNLQQSAKFPCEGRGK